MVCFALSDEDFFSCDDTDVGDYESDKAKDQLEIQKRLKEKFGYSGDDDTDGKVLFI